MGLRERMRTWTRDDINPDPPSGAPTLTHDEVVEIGRQVVLGIDPPAKESRAHSRARRRLTRQVRAMRKAGQVVELPVQDVEASFGQDPEAG